MHTFEIEMLTPADPVTVYTDSLEDFAAAMDVQALRPSRRLVGLPVLKGYAGPTLTGRVENGAAVIAYADLRITTKAQKQKASFGDCEHNMKKEVHNG